MKLFNFFKRKPKQNIIVNENDVVNILNNEIGKEFRLSKLEYKFSKSFSFKTKLSIDYNTLDNKEISKGMKCYWGIYENDKFHIDFWIFVNKENKILFVETVTNYD